MWFTEKQTEHIVYSFRLLFKWKLVNYNPYKADTQTTV